MQLLQLAIPRVIGQALDKSLLRSYAHCNAAPSIPTPAPIPISWFVAILVAFALVRLLLGYVYRLNLQKTSMAIEFDLRNTIYQKLSWLPFSYFDKVQSGQLISRANSDIRSVQMYLAFAPILVVNFIGLAIGCN